MVCPTAFTCTAIIHERLSNGTRTRVKVATPACMCTTVVHPQAVGIGGNSGFFPFSANAHWSAIDLFV
jgi:hypothetical protein